MVDAIWEHDYYDDCIPNFSNNFNKPRHRWYEFKEGYSDAFVSRAIRHYESTTNLNSGVILDPFSGSGTTSLVGVQNGYKALAFEVNPFMAFISRTKTKSFSEDIALLEDELKSILSCRPMELENILEGFSTFSPSEKNEKWLFNRSVLRGYEALRQSIDNCSIDNHRDFFILALYAATMDCCNAKRDGKCLRYKKSWKTLGYSSLELRESFIRFSKMIIEDLVRTPIREEKAQIINNDSRLGLKSIENKVANVITFSPPYLNSFDYSDVYRPELFLGGFVNTNDQLRHLRSKTLRSHVQYAWNDNTPCSSSWVTDIVTKIRDKENYLWNKNIPAMIHNYFSDMQEILRECYRVASSGAVMWFIVSTSAYAGIEIPVDLILADTATQCGWELESVNALRNLRTSSQCIDSDVRKVRLRESMVACRKR
ncbi:hypothetical protein [Desulfosporosinus youngiae]|uniref:DNA modification methylase n=1 Tax=Desulfosporosinus youngiae DSM 17734 TaxID=768710 RepID=H5XUI1_9FIRM|nr:hypothetical protein [Desulfosporosinus youngiae]EHQ88999.1 hypothetical protein DesyoDRAFT_1879 [Desulfosporosinus youngiae DSM 17734]